MSDLGFTHIALPVTDIDASVAFYGKYARMQVVSRRTDQSIQSDVAWISDLMRPFVVVLIKVPKVNSVLVPIAHLGVACETREEVDRLCREARTERVLLEGPQDLGYPVGYYAFLSDPDGHTLEISYGQDIAFTIEQVAGK